MPRSPIPQGYTVARLDDQQWYPLKIDYSYDTDHPEGIPLLGTLMEYKENDYQRIRFQRREEAVAFCQQEARFEREGEVRAWQRLTIKSDVYPERCSHYRDLITGITGQAPVVRQYPFYHGISVFVPSWRCSCNVLHVVDLDRVAGFFGFLRIEDALEEAATSVYASYQACQCSHGESSDRLAS